VWTELLCAELLQGECGAQLPVKSSSITGPATVPQQSHNTSTIHSAEHTHPHANAHTEAIKCTHKNIHSLSFLHTHIHQHVHNHTHRHKCTYPHINQIIVNMLVISVAARF